MVDAEEQKPASTTFVVTKGFLHVSCEEWFFEPDVGVTRLVFATTGEGHLQTTSAHASHKDVATIQRLEDEWSLAYLQGNTDFERCLLAPDFTEILRTGEVNFLADELELAAKNRGKNLAIPDLPKPKVLLHGNLAVAYGVSNSTASDGKVRETRFADSYLWENGTWHVFFAQQTQVPSSQGTVSSGGVP